MNRAIALAGRVAVLALLAAAPLHAQTAALRRPAGVNPHGITFTLDPARTAPGTIEMEFGVAAAQRAVGLPLIVKHTPDRLPWLRNTELAMHFGFVSLETSAGQRVFQAADTMGVIIRRPIYARGPFKLALSPRAAWFIRGAEREGVYGFGVLTGLAWGRTSFVANATAGRATAPSEANPRARGELLADVSRALGEQGLASKLALFAGVAYRMRSAHRATVSLGQGLSYRLRPNLEIDLAVRQEQLGADVFVAGLFNLTMNLGGYRPNPDP